MAGATSAAQVASAPSADTIVKDWTTENVLILANTSPTRDGKPNPLGDLHARKALAYATNCTAIADLIGEGVETPTSPWSPSNPWGMPDDQNGYVEFDLEKGR